MKTDFEQGDKAKTERVRMLALAPVKSLVWEIWARNRITVCLAASIIVGACLFNAILPHTYRATEAARERWLTLKCLLMTVSLLLVFGIFTYTESGADREFRGFPKRLFTLPVPTWLLVWLPICLGVLSLELVYGAWLKLVFVPGELARPGWLGILFGAGLVFYLGILWGMAGFRICRIIALAVVGILWVWVAFLPGFSAWLPSPWFSERRLVPAVLFAGIAAGFAAWLAVARQRNGAAGNRKWIRELVDCIADKLPRRRRVFPSPGSAQFWFEWRRSGLLLPACVAAAIALIILPASWLLRHDPAGTVWILGWIVAMPIFLALPVGKGFSKPDFWSRDLLLPPFVAVRPVATGDLVVTKMKVAAASAGVTWLVVLIFLSLWLPLWADLSDLTMIRVGFWMVYDHSVAPQFVIAALIIFAGMLLTWKFLVGGLWVGLSGSRRLFIGSGATYCGTGILAMVALGVLSNYADTHKDQPPDWNRFLAAVQWIAAGAVILKFWAAAFSWRFVSRKRVRRYLIVWLLSLCMLVVLAVLLWADGMLAALLRECPMDALRLKHFLILLTLLVIPFARIGLAPLSLGKNRHGAVM